MTFNVKVSITGIQEAQAKNNRVIAELQPSGALGRAVQYATIAAHRYAAGITHVGRYKRHGTWVGGGTLRASHRMEVGGLQGRVYIDPGSVNPRTGQRAAVYGPYEHERGGEHAFYQRTINEQGPSIEQAMMGLVKLGIVT